MDISKLEQIISILKKNDVTEFELEHDGTHIKLSRLGDMELVPAAPKKQAVSVNGQSSEAKPAATVEDISDSLFPVESPIVGTFYGRPSPDNDVFVKVGDSVSKGDTLCIVEAMKIMNEIEAPCAGRVDKICLSDGQVVEFGEVLFLIDPDG